MLSTVTVLYPCCQERPETGVGCCTSSGARRHMPQLCKFYAQAGRCAFGNACNMWHGDPTGTNGSNITNGGYKASANGTNGQDRLMQQALGGLGGVMGEVGATICRHFLQGRCDACRNLHTMPEPREPALPAVPVANGQSRCDHAFCLSCIRGWRREREQQDKQNLRLCPVCRNESFYVIPTDHIILDPEEKREVIDSYKQEMGRIPCKLFDYGRGHCPFGTSCFYAHLNPDGTRYIPPPLKWMRGAEGSQVKSEVKISDFFD
ncbi:putative E3 ubiquitin-protein ligase makorin-2 [Symbiodinium microadriaticum]|uniref:Putative E3 ubiquitin-protein ligase makorin-2 n=1 Tax=Symbiodinium microadriaticum TaxID=2951 RepID=A0A1Q9EMU6_SYMMI|nr:putative E3 ubiquitin-protein ligase makorin-2 [Symbiodinium microadriaticum]